MRQSRSDFDARFLRAVAPHDFLSSLAYAIGFRDWAYRRKAIDALRLEKGDRVVEIGCGTGRNFPLLERAVGPAGVVIAVDVSKATLARARQRVTRHGWSNIELESLPASLNSPPMASLVASRPHLLRLRAPGRRCTLLDVRLAA